MRLQAHEFGGQQQGGRKDARTPAIQGICAVQAGSGLEKGAHAALHATHKRGQQGQKDQCLLPEEQALLQPVMIKLVGGPLLDG